MKKCLCFLSVIFPRRFCFSRNIIFPAYDGYFVFFSQFFKVLYFLQKRSKNRDRQIRASNLNWRLSFLTRFSNKKPSKRCSSKNFLNNELFLLSFSFSSFLFEENFKILKEILMLKRNVRQIKITIISRKIFM